MFKSTQALARLVLAGLLAANLAACQKNETASGEKGPAERAGQQLDQAAARAGEELNKAAQAAGKGMQQLGQKIQNEAEQAQQGQQQKKE
jgi:predicted small secreted protein